MAQLGGIFRISFIAIFAAISVLNIAAPKSSYLEPEITRIKKIKSKLYKLAHETNQGSLALACAPYVSTKKLTADPYLAIRYILQQTGQLKHRIAAHQDPGNQEAIDAQKECNDLYRLVQSSGLINDVVDDLAFKLTTTSGEYIVMLRNYIEEHSKHFKGLSYKTAQQLARYRPGDANQALPEVIGGIFSKGDLTHIRTIVDQLEEKIQHNLAAYEWLRPHARQSRQTNAADTNLLTVDNIMLWVLIACNENRPIRSSIK
ncbi:MAG: hypothetical protein QG632_834 [Candidatus Dependentiae bacterium]|nr:hypothetical protein [Candidatus Dependentiae bacterium]